MLVIMIGGPRLLATDSTRVSEASAARERVPKESIVSSLWEN